MKTLLVTGGTGFIGRETLSLLKKKYQVHAISSKPNDRKNNSDIHWHHLNLFHPDAVNSLIRNLAPTHLLHLAWFVTHGKFWHSVENLRWVEASLRLFRSFVQYGGMRLIVAGSCAEYGESHESLSEKKSIFQPSTLYGSCKRALFQILEAFAREMEISFAWGYIFYPFGRGENPRRFIPSLIRGLLLNQEISCSSGKQLRDFLDVKEIAAALVALLDSSLTGGVNIASGRGISLREVALNIASLTGNAHLIRFGTLPERMGEAQQLVADVSRLHRELKWAPSLSFEQSLKETVHWWKRILL